MKRSAAVGLLALCLVAAAGALARGPVPFRTIAVGGESNAVGARAANVVVRDLAAWRQLWRQLHAGETPRPALPRVNFARHMLIAVRQGLTSSGGYDMRVTSIVDDGRRLRVTVDVSAPGPDCVTPAVITGPYHVVRTRRSAKRAVFARRVTVYDC